MTDSPVLRDGTGELQHFVCVKCYITGVYKNTVSCGSYMDTHMDTCGQTCSVLQHHCANKDSVFNDVEWKTGAWPNLQAPSSQALTRASPFLPGALCPGPFMRKSWRSREWKILTFNKIMCDCSWSIEHRIWLLLPQCLHVNKNFKKTKLVHIAHQLDIPAGIKSTQKFKLLSTL